MRPRASELCREWIGGKTEGNLVRTGNSCRNTGNHRKKRQETKLHYIYVCISVMIRTPSLLTLSWSVVYGRCVGTRALRPDDGDEYWSG